MSSIAISMETNLSYLTGKRGVPPYKRLRSMVSFAVRVFDMSSPYQQSAVPIPAWAQGVKVRLVFMFIRHLFCVVVRISPLIRWPIHCATTLLVQEYSDTDALPVRKSALNGGFSDEGKLTAPVKFLVTGSLSACKAVFQAHAPCCRAEAWQDRHTALTVNETFSAGP